VAGQQNETDESTDIRNKQTSKSDKSEHDANIVFECSNREKVRELQACLGELFLDSTLECSTWTKKTKEMPCFLVLPDDGSESEDDSSVCPVSGDTEVDKTSCIDTNSPILVERLSDPDGCRVAESLYLDLHVDTPENTMKELQLYVMDVKQFGFNHIIVIGKRYLGMLFMDCFGRVFDWNSDSHALWHLGDYFEIMESEMTYDDQTAWDVLEDGTVFVLHKCMYIYFAHILP